MIINDLTQDDKFKDRPFVTSRPSLRFYAAMPICTKAGFNIGSLCVLDDKPRDGLSDVEIGFLGDMVITIMSHLEIGRVKDEHRRSEKMVKGLGLFVEGGSTLREWWLEVRNDKAWLQQGSKDGAETKSNENSRPQQDLDPKSRSKDHISTTETTRPEVAGQSESLDNASRLPQPKPAEDTPARAQAEPAVEPRPLSATQRDCDEISTTPNLGNQKTISFPTPASSTSATPAREQDASPIRSTGDDQRSANSTPNVRTSTADLQETMLSENLKEMFSRASNIIRECIEVDGTIFLDASIGTFGGHTGESYDRLGRSELVGGRSQESIISSSEEEHGRAPASDVVTSGVSPAGSYGSQLPKKTLIEEKKKKGMRLQRTMFQLRRRFSRDFFTSTLADKYSTSAQSSPAQTTPDILTQMLDRPNLDLLRRFCERESPEKVLSRQKQKPSFRCFQVLVPLSYFRSGILTGKDGLQVALRGLPGRHEYSHALKI
jgi:hypothetical protein